MQQNPIVIIINALYPGGAERLVIDDIHELLRRGVSVRLVTLRQEKNGASSAGMLYMPKDHWRIIPFRNLFDIPAWFRLIRYLKLQHPQAAVTHLWLANTVGRVSAWLAGIKTILAFEHNVYENIKSGRHFFIDRLLVRLSTRMVAVTREVKRSLMCHGIPEEKISVILNGIDISRYEGFEPKSIRAKLGYPRDAFIFIWVGRCVRQKALDVLLQAFHMLQNSLLLLVGDGEEKESLRKLAAALGIGDRVHFLGFHDDIRELLAMADCFVLPSRWEGLPVALLEAMAAGKPVIAGDIDGIKEVVAHHQSALLVKPDDAELLASAMRKLMADNELRLRLADAGLVRVKDFSIKYHVDRIMELLQ